MYVFASLSLRKPYLDENIDVVCDLKGHHFDLVLTKQQNC